MGRKTLDSFPAADRCPSGGGLVITRSPDFHREGCETVSHAEDALALAGDEENVWLIGGGSIYAALLGRCRRASVASGQHRIGCRHLFPRSGRPP
ncbi:MAG: dihydrofolate reductase [Dysosmobacter sp.]